MICLTPCWHVPTYIDSKRKRQRDTGEEHRKDKAMFLQLGSEHIFCTSYNLAVTSESSILQLPDIDLYKARSQRRPLGITVGLRTRAPCDEVSG